MRGHKALSRGVIKTAKQLADVVVHSGIRSVAIVGTAKNVGKTVTMNYLVSELSARGLTVGLVSSGRDGETIDAFTGQPKPSVVAPQGAWIATAEGVLGDAAASLEIADVLGHQGLFGRLVLGQAIEPVALELVGPRSARKLAGIVDRLLELGADIVLVDGALDRMAAASPKVTGATILSTGASVDTDLETIAGQLGFLVWLLSRPEHPVKGIASLARQAIDTQTVCFIHAGRSAGRTGRQGQYSLRSTHYSTVLGVEDEVLEQAGEAAAVVVPGAVSQAFLDKARSWAKHREFAVIAGDTVSIFATKRPKVGLYVTHPLRLLAVTVNPVSALGISYDPRAMVSAIGIALRDIGYPLPVFDVVSGEMCTEEMSADEISADEMSADEMSAEEVRHMATG